VAGETGGLSDCGGLLGSEQTTELGGLDSDDVGGLLLDYGEGIGRGADGLIGHDRHANALGDLAEGIEVIGRRWLLKELPMKPWQKQKKPLKADWTKFWKKI